MEIRSGIMEDRPVQVGASQLIAVLMSHPRTVTAMVSACLLVSFVLAAAATLLHSVLVLFSYSEKGHWSDIVMLSLSRGA